MQNELRNKAKELLQSGQVSVVIGYEAGSVPFKSTPLFAQTPEDADRLVWNPTCVNNLSVYLPQAAAKEKVAVVLKPCDAGSVVELLKEHQIKRENVLAIMVACPGVLNSGALKDTDLRAVSAVDWKDGGVVVSGTAGNSVIPGAEAFAAKCGSCDGSASPIADIKIGNFATRQPSAGKSMSVEEYEKMSPAERRAFWTEQFSRCIRCYGCRSVCPGCYCRECFVDKQAQMWASKATDTTANWFFHTTRAMHIAGRCIGCGECERVCPMDIPLSLMNKKLIAEAGEMFGSKPGTDPEELPTLGCFTMHDPDPCPE